MIFLYILKSAATLALLYGVFFATMEHEAFHRFNRFMMLTIIILSFIIPALHITIGGDMPLPSAAHLLFSKDALTITGEGTNMGNSLNSQATLASTLQWVYLVGVAVMLTRLAVQVTRLYRNLSFGARCSDRYGNTIILKSGNVSPFSIFNYIVMSVDDYELNRQYILTHEQEHIRLHHSYDKLFMEIIKAVQWFNPAVWLISRNLNAVHEFEADEAVINQGIDAKKYQELLVKRAVGNRLQPFANNLNRGSLKRRIIMMNQKKTKRWAMLKALFILPAALVATATFAFESHNQMISQNTSVANIHKSSLPSKKHAKATSTPETMPEYPGGSDAMKSFIAKNIKYPESAKKAGKEGLCVVGFVIGKDGTPQDFKIAKSAGDAALDAEALRVAKLMPKWKPGTQKGKPVAVKYMMPLTFRTK